jgi:hypothetical protein
MKNKFSIKNLLLYLFTIMNISSLFNIFLLRVPDEKIGFLLNNKSDISGKIIKLDETWYYTTTPLVFILIQILLIILFYLFNKKN